MEELSVTELQEVSGGGGKSDPGGYGGVVAPSPQVDKASPILFGGRNFSGGYPY
jgi:bacteriocin-like protein